MLGATGGLGGSGLGGGARIFCLSHRINQGFVFYGAELELAQMIQLEVVFSKVMYTLCH